MYTSVYRQASHQARSPDDKDYPIRIVFEPTKRTPRGNNNGSKMAEGERSDNPFSFKTFVKSKQETIDVKIKKGKDKQHNSRKGEICPNESPFPEVTANKPVHSQQGKLQPLFMDKFIHANPPGLSGTLVKNRESPDFKSLEVGISASFGALLHFWGVLQFTQVQSLPSPHKQCWMHVSRPFFPSFNFV